MKTILQVRDELSTIRYFIECASMACSDLTKEHADPLMSVLDAATDKIKGVDEALEAIAGGLNAD